MVQNRKFGHTFISYRYTPLHTLTRKFFIFVKIVIKTIDEL